MITYGMNLNREHVRTASIGPLIKHIHVIAKLLGNQSKRLGRLNFQVNIKKFGQHVSMVRVN